MVWDAKVETATVNLPWYALRVKSRIEKTIASMVTEKGHETFLPLYRSRRQWSDRVKELELPMFPGYLFCRFDQEKRLPILTTPGVMGVVSCGRTLVPVSDAEIAALQLAVASRLPAEPWPFLQIGQHVRIDRGPLEGVEGIFVNAKKTHRLVISVTLLQRSVAVEVERGWVSPIAVAEARRPGSGRALASA